MYLFVLGRQPEIGFAEITAVFGRAELISPNIALVFDADETKFSRLGSVIKIAKIFDATDEISPEILSAKIAKNFPADGKLTIGLSSETRALDNNFLAKISRKIRHERENSGASFREISRERGATSLNSAAVFHNKLAGISARKAEIIFAKNQLAAPENFAKKILLAQTISVQNITSYTFRDRERPKRDARVGMLPPKLAQTIINLAGAANAKNGAILLDPFCGTGVILQEAALAGLAVFGTDIEPRMIDFSRENLDWLSRKFGRELGENRDFARKFAVADATTFRWNFSDDSGKNAAKFPDFVAGETYLGRAYSAEPSRENLEQNIKNCDHILREFLRNLHDQARAETGICLAVPAWFIRGKTWHLPLVASLEKIGFQREFSGLVYHREDQIVGRELLVLRRA